MSFSSIDFSAQFGGRDAAAVALPHFKALKAAANGINFDGFPFAKLAFILRVDGEVSRYDLSGLGNLDIDKDGEYLSFDISINMEDRRRIPKVITSAILSSVEQLRTLQQRHMWNIDLEALQQCLLNVVERYKIASAGFDLADRSCSQ